MSRSSRPQKIQAREQVAAVCYRIQDSRLEFLLVQTRRGGRWIFPKGGVEPGLTRSQSAALEALEEAGVRGSIEEAPFAQYTISERSGRERHSSGKLTIAAYLCAVSWVSAPCEAHRNPTWFSPDKAKKRLKQSRDRCFGQELCRVVDRAVMRVERLQRCSFAANDPLRRAQFEASESSANIHWQTFSPVRRVPGELQYSRQSVIVDVRAVAPARKVLQLGPASDPLRGMQFEPKLDGLPRNSSARSKKRTREYRTSSLQT